MKLIPGTIYDRSILTFNGWTVEADGYHADYYFDETGAYKGPDIHGVEPIFTLSEKGQEALERINGSTIGASVIYYDDSMHQHYLAPVADLADLAALMEDDDEDVARDAYSHWCAGVSHPECDEDGNLI